MMQLRRFQADDLIAIVKLEALCQSAPWPEGIFESCIKKKYPTWVLVASEEVIGFAMVSLAAGECHLLNICLHPTFQHQGYGRRLLESILAWAHDKHAAMIFLEVAISNMRAIALYRKLNFKEIGYRKNYYESSAGSEDAYVFALDLTYYEETPAYFVS